jgi:hypothetical protein
MRKATDIIDVHAHHGRWPFPIPAKDAQGMLALMDECGIGRAVVSSSLAIVCDMEAGNARVAELAAASERFLGYVVVNPNFADRSRREMDRHFANPSFVGAKIHPSYSCSPIGSERTQALIAEVAARGKPLLIHTWGAQEVEALNAATQDAGPPVIMGHAGGDAWREGIRAAAQNPRLYLEFCCSYAERDMIGQALALAGASKMLFGSDLTLLHPGLMLGMLDSVEMSDAERASIVAGNARRIFGLPVE